MNLFHCASIERHMLIFHKFLINNIHRKLLCFVHFILLIVSVILLKDDSIGVDIALWILRNEISFARSVLTRG